MSKVTLAEILDTAYRDHKHGDFTQTDKLTIEWFTDRWLLCRPDESDLGESLNHPKLLMSREYQKALGV